MTRLSLVAPFVRKFTIQFPDPEKDNQFRKYEFEGKFKMFPSTEDMRTELERMQKEKGMRGFLDEVMLDVKLIRPTEGLEFVDDNDEEMPLMEWIKTNIIAQQDATMAFWEVINKSVEEKNSRKSRSR